MLTEHDIRTQLQKIPYPGSRHDIVTLGLVGNIALQENNVIIHFRPSSATPDTLQRLTQKITTTLSTLPNIGTISVHTGRPSDPAARPSPVAAPSKTPLPGVGKVIAVASGKGGVGKSTVAV